MHADALDERWDEPETPAAVLRGTARGLEMVVRGSATGAAIELALARRLDEAPGFFRGNDVRVAVEDGPLAPGCLARIDALAERFELRVIEVAPAATPVPVPELAAGSAGNEVVPAPEPVPVVAAEPEPARAEPDPQPRLFIGPVRSGVILEHPGHLFIFGDVNPGAEVRAAGNITVLGRLRGTAHAAIGRDAGFILALRLEPQQLRIGRMVARAADSDAPASDAEIAYATGEQIVVERYLGKLPRNLATSL
ncbi:MAG TPA: septum site-determining protein MinC [Kofleriaceae bacterium]|nr:septum site-determining protein MinC [Kofleriaceae bacterium]